MPKSTNDTWETIEMKIKPIEGLEAKLKASEDAEELDDKHYSLDLYDNDPALTLEIEFTPKGTFVPAAALLKYSDELQGYYMDERVKDVAVIENALNAWMA